MATAARTGSAVAVEGSVAMALAENSRNCRGRQQSTKCGSGSGRDSIHGSGNCGSKAAMAGRGGSRGAAVAAVGTVAIMTADNSRNGGGRQQSTQWGCGISPLLDSHLANIQQFLLKVHQTRFPRNSICSANSHKIPFAWDLDLTPNPPGILSCVWCTTKWHYTNTNRKSRSEIPLVSMDDAKSCHEQFPPVFHLSLERQYRDKHAKCKLV
jgi:hypothetical protein